MRTDALARRTQVAMENRLRLILQAAALPHDFRAARIKPMVERLPVTYANEVIARLADGKPRFRIVLDATDVCPRNRLPAGEPAARSPDGGCRRIASVPRPPAR